MEKSSRRPWTIEEDKCLADCLLETYQDDKFKGKGGFKNGYLGNIEKLMGQKLIGTDLKANNIDSRLSYLKKQFFALNEIREKASGFGWDNEKKMVTGDRSVYFEWAKSHPAAKGLYMKPWPLHNIFEEVFAKDRATRANVATTADRSHQEMEQSSNNAKETVPLDKNEDTSFEESSRNVTSDQEGTTPRKTNRKRKLRNKYIDAMQEKVIDLMKHVIQSNNECVSQIISAFKANEKCDRTRLREELGKIPELSIIQRLQAMRKMTDHDVTVFYTLKDEDEKYAYVQIVLGLHG